MKTFLLSLFLLLSLERTNAQQVYELCGFDDIYHKQLREDPVFRERVKNADAQWQAFIANKNNIAQRLVVEGNDTVYEIPVVVHVIHTGGAIGTTFNKSDADIINWVEYANKIWSATWPGYPDTTNGGTRIPIRFVMARRSPSCTPTNGIDRVDGSVLPNYVTGGLNRADSAGVYEAQIKALARWNPSLYYNIYVVNKIDGKDGITNIGSFVSGFAYYAGTSGTYDGAFMLSATVSTSSQTLPHELGHAMGLMHTFEGAGSYPNCDTNRTNCNTQGDMVCDTEWCPNNLGQNPCPTNANTNPCTMLPYNNVQYNIMNYGSCRNRFTPGQRDRAVQKMLLNRLSLINSLALDTIPAISPALVATCSVPVNVIDSANTNIGPCNVNLNSIQYMSHGYSSDNYKAYIDHSLNYCLEGAVSTDLIVGTPYQFTVSTELNSQRLKAYIDYNNNGIFDITAGENVLYIDNAAPGLHTITLTPPLTATLNTYVRLRIMSDTRNTNYNAFNYGPCDTMRSGQVEDFYVRFLDNVPLGNYISSFTANTANCNVNLNWTLNNGTNKVSSFILERSADAKTFTELANIATQNDNTSYIDTHPFNGANYYRLKWTNAAGNIAYSSIRHTELNCNNVIKVYPNPFNRQFTLELNVNTNQNIKMEVYDISGKRVWQASAKIGKGISRTDIDLDSLSNAIYILKVIGDDINNQIMIVKDVQ